MSTVRQPRRNADQAVPDAEPNTGEDAVSAAPSPAARQLFDQMIALVTLSDAQAAFLARNATVAMTRVDAPQEVFRRVFAALLARDEGDLVSSLAEAAQGIERKPWPLTTASDECAKAGDLKRALALADLLAAGDNGAVATLRQRLRVYLLRKDFAAATTLLDALDAETRKLTWVDRAWVTIGTETENGALLVATGKRLAASLPGSHEGGLAILTGLLQLKQIDEAMAMLPELTRNHPHQVDLRALAVQATTAAGKLPEALAMAEALRRDFPKSPAGYTRGIAVLTRMGKPHDADALGKQAAALFPRNLPILRLAAATASHCRNHNDEADYWLAISALTPADPEASLMTVQAVLKRPSWKKRVKEVGALLKSHYARFPDHRPAYRLHVSCLRNAKDFEGAHAVAQSALERFPDDLELALEQADIFLDEGMSGKAVLCLRDLRNRVPALAKIEKAYVRTLSTAGQHNEAEAACAAALAKFPHSRPLCVEYARLASRMGNWDEAVKRLEEALTRLPADPTLMRELQHLRDAALVPTDVSRSDGGHLISQFESLGGMGTGCEFALVQRKFGCDRLGLLRWARMSPQEMTAALEREFEGVGSEEQTLLTEIRWAVTRREYYTEDREYGMSSHTFVDASEIPADKFFKQVCRRLKFLTAKLLEDLRAGGRIFVYKANIRLEDAVVTQMFEVFSRFGDNALLIVSPALDDHKPGEVVSPLPRLLMGYISSFMDTGPGGIKYDIWHDMCVKAAQIWPPRKAEPDAPEAS